ncbi:MAG: chromosomal replication initiator protein DnaA [bacterium]|nr:chromosomal replication initiator protein DnaA [bacterium]
MEENKQPLAGEKSREMLWREALDTIRISVSPANFTTWFIQTSVVSIKKLSEERQLVEVSCPSSFIADSIQRRYFGLIQDALNQTTGLKNDLSFVIGPPLLRSRVDSLPTSPLFSSEKNGGFLADTLRGARVRPGFTFENFAVSGTNQMAHAAAEAVSKNLGGSYNPLFIWGGVGIGKTHLMLAIAHRVLSRSPEEKVLYCMGEEFTNEIVEAIREKTMLAFKKRYRNLKLLLLDDVQFIAGKVAVQEEFFHTFNTLEREGRQIVLTSDRPPDEIPKLEGRLRSRFEAGLIVDISPPDFELRVAITQIKAKEKGVSLSMGAAQAVASNLDSPRKIEGFLAKLISENGVGKGEITEDRVVGFLGKVAKDNQKSKKSVGPQEFISSVAEHFSLGKRRLLGKNRSRAVSFPRQILMYLLRTELGLPLQEVGRVMGGKDHTTVMHAVDKISKNLSTNQKLREDIVGIKQAASG